MGRGEFVETMLRKNMLPSGMDLQNPYHTHEYTSPSRGLASWNGQEALPNALAFHRRISRLAAALGLLARDIRAEEDRNPNDRSMTTMRSRQERIAALQDTLRRTWSVQMPVSVASGYCNQVLPVGARGIFEHVSDRILICLKFRSLVYKKPHRSPTFNFSSREGARRTTVDILYSLSRCTAPA